MSMVTVEEARGYLRAGENVDDDQIASLLVSAEKITADVARLSAAEWNAVCDEMTEVMTIRGTEILVAEILQLRSLLRTALLYALGYLYEHWEESDHRALVVALRKLLRSPSQSK